MERTLNHLHNDRQSIREKTKTIARLTASGLMLVLTANQANSQTTYEKIPTGFHIGIDVLVQDKVLDVLEMSPEQFKQQIVDKDIRNLNNALYYSEVAESKAQPVIELNDLTYLSKVDLPDSNGDGNQRDTKQLATQLTDNTDGLLDQQIEQIFCNEVKLVLLYNDGAPLWLARGEVAISPHTGQPISVVASNVTAVDDFTRQGDQVYEFGRTFLHKEGEPLAERYNQGTAWAQVDTIVPNSPAYEYLTEEMVIPEEYIEFTYGTKTAMSGGRVNERLNIYSNPSIHQPDFTINDTIFITEGQPNIINDTLYHPNIFGKFDTIPVQSIDTITVNIADDIAAYLMQQERLEATIISSADSIPLGETLHLDAQISRENIEDYTFTRSVSHNGQIVEERTGVSLDYQPDSLGVRSFELTATNECNSQTVKAKQETTVYDIDSPVVDIPLQTITLSPNPTNGGVYLDGDLQLVKEVRIYTQYGQLLTAGAPFTEIDLSNMPHGLYYIQLIDHDHQHAIHKIIKQ